MKGIMNLFIIIILLKVILVVGNEYALDEDLEIHDHENNIKYDRNDDFDNNNKKKVNIPANEEFEFSNEQEYMEYEAQRLNNRKMGTNSKYTNNSKHTTGSRPPHMSKMTNTKGTEQDTIIDPNQALNPNGNEENKDKNLFFIEKIFTPEVLLVLEFVSFITFFLFCLNYFFGKMQNYNILENWNKNTKDFFIENYAHVGFNKETQYDLPFL